MSQDVAVYLPSQIVYVYGTVNGVTVEWDLIGGAWRATVESSPDTMYVIALEAYDEAGNYETYNVTLQYGLKLIFDRTLQDAQRAVTLNSKPWSDFTAAEKTEYLAGLKGAYNASDLNRVGTAVQFLADLLHEYGYTAAVSTKTDWMRGDLPDVSDLDTYLNNVTLLIKAYYVLATTPDPPDSMNKLDYEGANAIEKILFDIYYLIQLMSAEQLYSGEISCGEDDWI